MNKRKINAFTLVELLIVIALIGILSVAVLATINPIEQANKARDAKFKNDAAEILSAYERYYASQNNYPWNLVGTTVATDWVGSFESNEEEFGILGAGGTGTGALVVTSELKSSFAGKEPFRGADTVDTDYLYTYHTTSGDNYVCFLPKANANHTGASLDLLKCLSGTGPSTTLVDYDGSGCDVPDPWVYSIGSSIANLLCVPEGDIQ